MNTRTRRLIGWLVAAVGAVIAIVGGLADQMGLGGEGSDEFGPKQVVALVVGIVLFAAGLALALWRRKPAEPTSAPPASQPDGERAEGPSGPPTAATPP